MDNKNKPAYPLNLEALGGEISDAIDKKIANKRLGNLLSEYTGLTKRERFAMAAMQGILSSDENKAGIIATLENHGYENDTDNVAVVVAEESVIMADALLKELDK